MPCTRRSLTVALGPLLLSACAGASPSGNVPNTVPTTPAAATDDRDAPTPFSAEDARRHVAPFSAHHAPDCHRAWLDQAPIHALVPVVLTVLFEAHGGATHVSVEPGPGIGWLDVDSLNQCLIEAGQEIRFPDGASVALPLQLRTPLARDAHETLRLLCTTAAEAPATLREDPGAFREHVARVYSDHCRDTGLRTCALPELLAAHAGPEDMPAAFAGLLLAHGVHHDCPLDP